MKTVLLATALIGCVGIAAIDQIRLAGARAELGRLRADTAELLQIEIDRTHLMELAEKLLRECAATAASAAIARQEGFYAPGSLPARLHNPGALVFAHQMAASAGDAGYAAFATDADGWRALDRDIARKRHDGVPLSRAWAYLPGGAPCIR